MRRPLKCLCVILAVVAWGALATAEPVSSLKPTDCVNDFAGVLSPSTITQLKEMCRQVLDKAQASVVVVTVKSTDGAEIFNYAVDLGAKIDEALEAVPSDPAPLLARRTASPRSGVFRRNGSNSPPNPVTSQLDDITK